MKFPKRWQDCAPFVRALKRREYIRSSTGEHVMPEGVYLYLYELWQDGVIRGWRQADKATRAVLGDVPTRSEPIKPTARRSPRVA